MLMAVSSAIAPLQSNSMHNPKSEIDIVDTSRRPHYYSGATIHQITPFKQRTNIHE